ncbi:glycosyltransferase, partial [Candidatus Parcubacteria bacterium]
LKYLKPEALVQLDADGQVSADVLPKLLNTLEDGYDLALGSRFVAGGANKLSALRRLFSMGASVICRVLMGPWNIGEFTNSARAFTPELFNKINFNRMPWKEKTFIVQPAFLNEAILAGAKYKEVPLVFKNREEGYSKNKVFNYTYDVIIYALDARLHKWNINIPLFYLSRRAKTLIKFALVGFTGTIVDFLFYKFFIIFFGFPPATSKGLSAEIAILNNFSLNNFWTFRYRKTKTNIWQKLGIFNIVSLGGLAIGVLIVKFLHTIFGDGFIEVFGRPFAYNNFYFFATIPPVMLWNFIVNHYITWRHSK